MMGGGFIWVSSFQENKKVLKWSFKAQILLWEALLIYIIRHECDSFYIYMYIENRVQVINCQTNSISIRKSTVWLKEIYRCWLFHWNIKTWATPTVMHLNNTL